MAIGDASIVEKKAYLKSQLWRTAIALVASSYALTVTNRPSVPVQSRWAADLLFITLLLYQSSKLFRAWRCVRGLNA